MYRLFLLSLVGLLLLIPAAPTFAQLDDDDSTFYDCNPYTTLDNLAITLTFISDLPSLQSALIYAGEYLINCGEIWLNMLLDGTFFIQTDEVIPPMNGMDDYGFNGEAFDYGGEDLSADDAEVAITSAFEGQPDFANSYFCEFDQFDAEDEEILANATLNSVDCEDAEDGTIACEFDITFTENGEESDFVDTTTFYIVDGLLCSQQP